MMSSGVYEREVTRVNYVGGDPDAELAAALAWPNWIVASSASAEAALAKIETDIPMAVVLGDGVEPLDLARCIKRDARTRHVALVLVTRELTINVQEASRAGIGAVLQAPYAAMEIVAAVRSALSIAALLERRRAARAAGVDATANVSAPLRRRG